MALRLDLEDIDNIASTHAPHLMAGPPGGNNADLIRSAGGMSSGTRAFAPGSPEYAGALSESLVPKSAGDTSASRLSDTLTPPKSPEAPLKTSTLRAGKPGIDEPIGSPGYFRERLGQEEWSKEHPWGSPDNHPGFLGKLGHIAAKVGNIGGELLDPGFTSMIPGSELNRRGVEAGLESNLQKSEQQETAREGVRQRGAIAEDKNAQSKQKELDALAEHGLTRDESGAVVPLPPEKLSAPARQKLEDSQKLDAYRAAQTQLAEANEELKRSQNDPNSPQFQMAMKKLQMAQLAHQIAAQNLGLHEAQFQNKLSEQELVKPSGQSQSRGSAAQAVLDVIPDLKNLVNKNRDQMGPLIGRLNKGEIAIGNLPPDIARLVSSMESFYALQPAVHGFRNFEVVKDFKTAMGTLERDPDSFIAGMEGLTPTLNAVAKEGKTSHKRIVEGRDTPAAGGGSAAPKAGDVVDGYEFKGGNPADKNSWKKATAVH